MILSTWITEDSSTTTLEWLFDVQRTKDGNINLKTTVLLSYDTEITRENNKLLKI